LQAEKIDHEKLKNAFIEKQEHESLLRMENDIIGEKLSKLYEAMDSLGDAKMAEDRFKLMIERLEGDKEDLLKKVEELQTEISRKIVEGKENETFLKELRSRNKKLHDEKILLI